MLTIPLVDGIAKHLSAAHSPLYVSWARYVAACVIVLPLAIARFGGLFLPDVQFGANVLRTAFLVAAMTSYFVAIAHIPLATAASAYFVGPIIAMLLAVILLRETVTPRKIVSLLLGFAGTLIILRPTREIEPGILFALAAGTCFAFYMIVTRQAAKAIDPLKMLAFQCLVGALLLTPQAIWSWSVPQFSELPVFLAMGVLSAGSHFLSIAAFRYAEASTLAPLVYLELLGASLIGYFAFGEVPSAYVWAGALAILAGGAILLPRKAESP